MLKVVFNKIRHILQITTAAYTGTTFKHKHFLPFKNGSHKLHHQLTNHPHPLSAHSLPSSPAVPHLWYLSPARKPSSFCLYGSCSSCPLQQAAGSSDQRLQHLYASIPEDTAPFSSIEPLSTRGELISGIDEPHVTIHRLHTKLPIKDMPHAESTLSQCYIYTYKLWLWISYKTQLMFTHTHTHTHTV